MGYLLHKPLCEFCVAVFIGKEESLVVLMDNFTTVRTSYRCLRHIRRYDKRELSHSFYGQIKRRAHSSYDADILSNELIKILLEVGRLWKDLQINRFLQKLETFFRTKTQSGVIDSVGHVQIGLEGHVVLKLLALLLFHFISNYN